MRIGFWKDRSYNLDKMSLRGLNLAFAAYPAVLAYVTIGLASLAVSLWLRDGVSYGALAAAALAAVLLYPVIWYSLHRWVLHGRYLYRSRWTARVWKRIHFDHHQDPHNLHVLFGALYTTLPTIALATMPIGYWIGGLAGAFAGFAAGIFTTCFYEYCHCVQHLNFTPKRKFLQEIKRLHLAHHFHNEQGNYGITNYIPDRLFGTFYAKAKEIPRSPTVFNLGYTEEEAERYPWVQRYSDGIRRDEGPGRTRAHQQMQTEANPLKGG